MIKYTEEEVKESDSSSSEYTPKKEFKAGSYYCEVKEVRPSLKRENQFGLCFKEVQSGEIICWGDDDVYDIACAYGRVLDIA